jgi:hypothetical protein
MAGFVYRVRLHSHDVKYGSGSGQQSVTGTTLKVTLGVVKVAITRNYDTSEI